MEPLVREYKRLDLGPFRKNYFRLKKMSKGWLCLLIAHQRLDFLYKAGTHCTSFEHCIQCWESMVMERGFCSIAQRTNCCMHQGPCILGLKLLKAF